jgi:hypothetical protein
MSLRLARLTAFFKPKASTPWLGSYGVASVAPRASPRGFK